MAIFNYEKFRDEYNRITALIGNLEAEDESSIGGVMKGTDTVLNRALTDAEQSQWASSKLNDWTPLYNSLKSRLMTLQSLLDAAVAGNNEYQAWEKQNSGM